MRSYGGELPQERRDRRRTQLLDAAAELARSEGVDRLTVRGVTRHARLNDRYFYESFASLDELLGACFDRAIGETLAVLQGELSKDAVDLEARTRATVSSTLQHLIDHPEATAVMLAGRTNPVLAERRATLVDTVTRMFVAQAAAAHSGTALSPVRAHLAALTLVNGALETTCLWLIGEVDASREDLVEHLVAAIIDTLATIPAAAAR